VVGIKIYPTDIQKNPRKGAKNGAGGGRGREEGEMRSDTIHGKIKNTEKK